VNISLEGAGHPTNSLAGPTWSSKIHDVRNHIPLSSLLNTKQSHVTRSFPARHSSP
jgi:hypothetical protein